MKFWSPSLTQQQTFCRDWVWLVTETSIDHESIQSNKDSLSTVVLFLLFPPVSLQPPDKPETIHTFTILHRLLSHIVSVHLRPMHKLIFAETFHEFIQNITARWIPDEDNQITKLRIAIANSPQNWEKSTRYSGCCFFRNFPVDIDLLSEVACLDHNRKHG